MQEHRQLLEIFGSPAELHPELAACVAKSGGFTMVQHPLVHTFYAPGHESILNHTLISKQAARDKYLKDGRADMVIEALYEKPYRLQALLDYGDQLTDQMFWAVTGSVWMIMEYFHDQLPLWGRVFDCGRPEREQIMSPEEREELLAMDDEIEIFRGGSPDGWSWTVNESVAEWFAKRFGREHDVHSRMIMKDDVIAYLNGRDEEEIIWRPTA